MGTTISIAVYADHAQAAPAFGHLVQRMLVGSALFSAKRHERGIWENTQTLDRDYVVSNAQSLAESMLDSRNALSLRLGYILVSGQRLGLNLRFYGTGYEEGWEVRDNGHVCLTFELTDLNKPLSDLWEQQPDLSLAVLTEQSRPIITANAVELFLRASGGLAQFPDDPLIEHGAMYLENGWASAAGCIMLYHRDVAEFARDFGRIYAEYQFGAPMPLLLKPGQEVWSLSEAELAGSRGPLKAQPDFYRQFVVEPPDDILRFLARLDRATAQELSALPAEFVHTALRDVQTHVPEVQVHDLGERGMALTTTPPGSIWRTYQYLASVART